MYMLIPVVLIIVFALMWRAEKKPKRHILVTHKRDMNDIIELRITNDIVKLIARNMEYSTTYWTDTKFDPLLRDMEHLPALVYDRLLITTSSDGWLYISYIVDNLTINVIGYVSPSHLIRDKSENITNNNDDDIIVSMRCNDSIDINGIIANNVPDIIPFVKKSIDTTSYGYALLSTSEIETKIGLLDRRKYYNVNGRYTTAHKKELGYYNW